MERKKLGLNRPGLRFRRGLRSPLRCQAEKSQTSPTVIELVRSQKKNGRSVRWSHFNVDLHIGTQDSVSKQRHETLKFILAILSKLDFVARSTKDISEIDFKVLTESLVQLQEQVHQLQKAQVEHSRPLSCADFFYWYGLVKSLIQIIRRPARVFTLEEILRINACLIEEQKRSQNSTKESQETLKKLTSRLKENTTVYTWDSYFKFVKKAFELLHYVFNWVEVSSNLVVNDEQFIHFLFVLIPVQTHDVFIECTTVLEDVLATKTKSMLELKRIPILKEVVQSCTSSQFPFLCRVIAVVMSDNDNAKPDNDTLKAHDEWLLNSTNHAISDANQKILISLGASKFVERLINLSKRPLNEADNVWETLENLQSWVATTYVTQNSIHLLRSSLQEVMMRNHDPRPLESTADSPLEKLKIHNEKMYKIEALFILTLLLCGNHKEAVQEQVSQRLLISGLNKLFNTFIWESDHHDDPPLAIPPTDDCSADTALKVQFLRLVHSVCDHHDNKYLLLSKPELEEILTDCKRLSATPNPSIQNVLDNELYCGEEKGLLSNILVAMKEAKETSTLRFWIARAVESFLRGPTCIVDQVSEFSFLYNSYNQTFYLNRGILQHLLHLLLEIKTSSEVSQGHFDLLAELMKFNEQAFEMFESAIGDNGRFNRFMTLAESSLVDSNMFIRCATLTYHKFIRAGFDFSKSKLLYYMSSKQIRARLVASLIELITPETLNQENVSCLNTSLVFMITARRENGLEYYLSDLSRRKNSDGVPLLENYQELLEFWLGHYTLSVKAKDCQSLEQGTGIKFGEWTSTVEILLGRLPPDETESSLIKYLPRKDRSQRDKSVSRLT